MQKANSALDILSEVLTAVLSANETDTKKIEGTKNMIRQLFLSGAKEAEIQKALVMLKVVVDKHASTIEEMKKPCTDCEKEKAKAVIEATPNAFGL